MGEPNVSVRLLRDKSVGGRMHRPGEWVWVPESKAEKWKAIGIADDGPPWEESAERHVLMLSAHCCTRVIKQAAALRDRGWRVDSLSTHIPKMPEHFDSIRVVPEADLADETRANGARIIHVHNEPDRLMRHADAGANGRPVVYDCHDLGYYRGFKVDADEVFAFERADGIIHVSKEHRGQAWSLHKWDAFDAITMSAPLRAWAPPPANDRQRKGVVYEGGSRPNSNATNRFRDHVVVARKFDEAGIPFDLYVPAQAAFFYPRGRLMVPYPVLVKLLTHYKWGFIGTDIKTKKGDTCLPNKLFEYAMCGLPILGCNVPAVEEFMDGEGGLYDTDMDRLIERMERADWFTLQQQVISRQRFMDDEIENTLEVYDKVMGAFACGICGQKFANEKGRKGHIRIKHPEEWERLKQAECAASQA